LFTRARTKVHQLSCTDTLIQTPKHTYSPQHNRQHPNSAVRQYLDLFTAYTNFDHTAAAT